MAAAAARATATTPATASTALNNIERAHQMYREGRHGEALGLYTEALALAKSKAQKIALHSNRAACYLKLHDFKKAAEECSSVLEMDHQHTGALMLRAQTLVTLKDYQSALFDVNRLMELNPASDVYRNLQARLRTQLLLAPIPESEEESLSVKENEEESALVAGDKKNELSMKEKITLVNRKKINEANKKNEPPSTNPQPPVTNLVAPNNLHPKGRETILKPKGHSALDYSRWDRVEDESSEEEDDEEEEQQPQYRFRVRTVGVRPVK